ncbi:helix-turn-helix domain-containing protein [Anaerovibrio sp. RM50]|uniref:helix-turn-helix domain-containing protein n=1 Tax=Anaerovibrio sp. RM50 TaxID=1200557 RepID=UPI000488586D|nr:helix-turn-helix transcriptional regulator [Anaerovibrio sp. RM50]
MNETIGTRLKELRLQKDYTQEYVGNIIGVSKQTLYKYENGIVTNIPSDKIEALAKVYGVTPEYIMGWATPSSEPDRPSYYADPETAEVAERLRTQPGMRMLFDASKDAKPEDLQYAADLLKRLKGNE